MEQEKRQPIGARFYLNATRKREKEKRKREEKRKKAQSQSPQQKCAQPPMDSAPKAQSRCPPKLQGQIARPILNYKL